MIKRYYFPILPDDCDDDDDLDCDRPPFIKEVTVYVPTESQFTGLLNAAGQRIYASSRIPCGFDLNTRRRG